MKLLQKLIFQDKDAQQIILNPNVKELDKKYGKVWVDKTIPLKQLGQQKKQGENLKNIPAVKDLIEQIKEIHLKNPKILEIGCSTGYHYDAFVSSNLKVLYEGCDISPEFIKIAKDNHPKAIFKISDATKLSYSSKKFDVVISGCCILHIINYQKAISEAARVARKFVILHRTPVIHLRETTYTRKIGYGLEMVEIIFNENELISLLRQKGLAVIGIKSHGQFTVAGINEPVMMKNYLCEKL